jgi:VanZ like family.
MRLIARIIAALVIVVLIGLMLAPVPTMDVQISSMDKLAHAGAFTVIPICLAILFPFGRLSTLALVSILLGGAIELIQGQIGRDPSWTDLFADAVGILLAVSILGALRLRDARRALQAVSES